MKDVIIVTLFSSGAVAVGAIAVLIVTLIQQAVQSDRRRKY